MAETVREPCWGAKVDKADSARFCAEIRTTLQTAEQVLCVITSGPAGYIVVTDRRVALFASRTTPHKRFLADVGRSRIASAYICRIGLARTTTLVVRTGDGREVRIGEVEPADGDLVLNVIHSGVATDVASLRFNPPPGWPAPPVGWRPTHGWNPDPSWPPPPADWQFWVKPTPSVVSAYHAPVHDESEPSFRRTDASAEPVDGVEGFAGRLDGDWRPSVPTSGHVELLPDPRALDSLGRNHSLSTALADLIDNSIDAEASDVLVRFVRNEGRLCGVYVVDNGRGIAPGAIDAAMTIGGRREYTENDLGHFGLGLKAASFSQAAELTVLTRAAGHAAVGRRWVLTSGRSGFTCDVVLGEFALAELTRAWDIPISDSGTVVRWDAVSRFPASTDPDSVNTYLESTINGLSKHLGLTFHRLIESGQITISVDVEDAGSLYPGTRIEVEPIDPFGYTRSGAAGYPKALYAQTEAGTLTFNAHIWPGRSGSERFKLILGPHMHQGLYFYRNGRLLQAGGDWHGISELDKHLQLARVSIDIESSPVGLFKMNPEKSRVIPSTEFTALAHRAAAQDDTTFIDYLQWAKEHQREASKRNRNRKPMIPPGKGFTPALRKAIGREIPVRDGAEPINFKWKRFENGDDIFFEVDRETSTLWLNAKYRPELSPNSQRASVNDAALLKALLYLLVEDVFQGDYLGSRDRDNIELWQEILTAAAQDE